MKCEIPPHQKHSYFIATLDVLTQFRRILIKLREADKLAKTVKIEKIRSKTAGIKMPLLH